MAHIIGAIVVGMILWEIHPVALVVGMALCIIPHLKSRAPIFGLHYFISMEKDPKSDRDFIITLEKIPGILGRLFGTKAKVERFVGDCTVWHNLETGRRAGTRIESLLCDYWYMREREMRSSTAPAT